MSTSTVSRLDVAQLFLRQFLPFGWSLRKEIVTDDRFDLRLREMMGEADLTSDVMAGMRGRLREFVRPFAASLTEPEQRAHTAEYVSGLLSRLEHKTSEAIAYLHD
ncbi:MAG: Mobile element protein [Gemmataceae bacterium]|nr:Mobile element protein [Gemmataceae bacterium]